MVYNRKVGDHLCVKISAKSRYDHIWLKVLEEDTNILGFEVEMMKLLVILKESIFGSVGAMSIKIGA